MKELKFIIDYEKIEPNEIQYAGVQGSVNSTSLLFEITSVYSNSLPLAVQLDYVDGLGAFSSIPQSEMRLYGEMEEGTLEKKWFVSVILPEQVSIAGGIAIFTLKLVNLANVTEFSSSPIRIYFSPSAQGTKGYEIFKKSFTASLDLVLKTLGNKDESEDKNGSVFARLKYLFSRLRTQPNISDIVLDLGGFIEMKFNYKYGGQNYTTTPVNFVALSPNEGYWYLGIDAEINGISFSSEGIGNVVNPVCVLKLKRVQNTLTVEDIIPIPTTNETATKFAVLMSDKLEQKLKKLESTAGNIPVFEFDGQLGDIGISSEYIICRDPLFNKDDILVFTEGGNAKSSGKTINSFVEKQAGKGLSTNDFTNFYKNQITDISSFVSNRVFSKSEVGALQQKGIIPIPVSASYCFWPEINTSLLSETNIKKMLESEIYFYLPEYKYNTTPASQQTLMKPIGIPGFESGLPYYSKPYEYDSPIGIHVNNSSYEFFFEDNDINYFCEMMLYLPQEYPYDIAVSGAINETKEYFWVKLDPSVTEYQNVEIAVMAAFRTVIIPIMQDVVDPSNILTSSSEAFNNITLSTLQGDCVWNELNQHGPSYTYDVYSINNIPDFERLNYIELYPYHCSGVFKTFTKSQLENSTYLFSLCELTQVEGRLIPKDLTIAFKFYYN